MTLGGQFRSRLPASIDVESREHVEQGERTLSKEEYNRPCQMKLEFSTVQFDESRGTFVDAELRAQQTAHIEETSRQTER